jgi:hypothetical protein
VSKKEDEAFEKWKEQERAKLSEEQQKHWDALIQDDKVKESLFKGKLREDDYYRRVQDVTNQQKELEARETKLNAWWESAKPEWEQAREEAKKKSEEAEELRKQLVAFGLEDDPVTNPVTPPLNAKEIEELTAKYNDLEGRLKFMDAGLPRLMQDFGMVLTEQAEAKFKVTPEQVIQHSMDKQVTTRQAFAELTAAERAERAQAAREAELEAAKAEAKEAGRREALDNLRTPDALKPAGPNILDEIKKRGPGPGDALKRHELSNLATQAYLEEYADK